MGDHGGEWWDHALDAWLAEEVGLVGPLRLDRHVEGRSNVTVTVTDATGRAAVVRRPPPGDQPSTAHDMAREAKILGALHPAGLPVPEVLAVGEEPGRPGTAFYVMERLGGEILTEDSAAALEPTVRVGLAEALVDALADLHRLDPAAVGLADLGRADGYLTRQLRRWGGMVERGELAGPDLLTAADRLAAVAPDQQRGCVVHGDYRFGNCLVDTTGATVVGILDWELCTLGDPLADLAHLATWWVDERSALLPEDPTAAGGFPDVAALTTRYAERTGLDLGSFDYYRAFAAWRLAAIGQGVHRRMRQGQVHGASADDVAYIETSTVALARFAVDRLAAA
ncbi:MAG: phosphotransferase family protein [Acidimicrobiia bacterium]